LLESITITLIAISPAWRVRLGTGYSKRGQYSLACRKAVKRAPLELEGKLATVRLVLGPIVEALITQNQSVQAISF